MSKTKTTFSHNCECDECESLLKLLSTQMVAFGILKVKKHEGYIQGVCS